ncbi:hypothetical protein [Kordia jejudonensis]|uniref:hypothetical protein n=1 Tax=Kordia jejudonensis TaxID=1348245 RepID=UPI0006291299|nr:hypothetical protein [Kordia jejudonensis]
MKRSLKLKKIKISKINNIVAGALPRQDAQQADRITDFDLCGDTKIYGDCNPQTNNNRTNRTGVAQPAHSGVQN